jgi:hypothetical protein
VYLDDVAPGTLDRRAGTRWGYWQPADVRDERRGLFGEMHLVASRVRADLVAHELFHVVIDRLGSVTTRNEERAARLMDELTRNWWKEYDRA